MNNKERLKKLNKIMAQMDMSCDQLWRFVQEDSVLERIDGLRDEYIENDKPTDRDILVCVCATLVFGEALKRRADKERGIL